LIVVRTILHRQRQESLFGDAVVEACRFALNGDGDRDRCNIDHVEEDAKIARDANVRSAIDQGGLPKRDGRCRIATETVNARFADDVGYAIDLCGS
jgi:hypothetical protein